MKIREFLQRSRQRLATCLPEASFHEIAHLLHERGIGAMPVCQLGTHMVGIISERDLVRALATTSWDELKYLRARDMMTKNVVTIGPDETMQEAQDQMSTYNFRHLPVVENDRVIGMLSLRDTLGVRLKEAVSEINLLRDVVAASRHA